MAAKHGKSREAKGQTAAISDPPAETLPGFPVVGIGASAGGLAAFEAFFSAMPSNDPGMAFVLVQHLAPDHKSILSELVQRYTRMKVFDVTDGLVVKPNCAYIIPPNYDMAFLNGTLRLIPPSVPRGHRFPIDYFFRSLAQDQRERGICVILSGTGSDGTLGMRAVKGEGGMAMVQDPLSTEYDGMPLNAIATGLVDYVLTPEKMPPQLAAYAKRASGGPSRPVSGPASKTEDILAKVFINVRARTGHDFSGYKQDMISRRMHRRMALHHIELQTEYLQYLQQTPAEVDALFRDFLIGVTSFFRDPEAFSALEHEVIPKLFAGKPAGSTVRVWVPACSTGEEAYSIAMLLQERLEVLQKSFQLQVFATDIDHSGIQMARAGVYPASISMDLSPARLARHFMPDSDGSTYRVAKAIRDMLVFSEQDVTRDPPFSKLDLISCRNLLIYMASDLQKKLIPLFHYALNPSGFLALGSSDSIGEFSSLFAVVDRKSKIYQRNTELYGLYKPAVSGSRAAMAKQDSIPRPGARIHREIEYSLREVIERTLLQEYAPASAIVSHDGEIHYLHGRTGLYLEPAQGEASMNIFMMAREGLRRDLTVALHTASSRRQSVRHPGVQVKSNGGYTCIDLEVRPMTETSAGVLGEVLFLVLFEEAPAAPAPADAQIAADADAGKAAEQYPEVDTRIATLRQELRAKEEFLQSTLEEMETSNEELKSSEEEMQSVNEELQSTNEELETSKEELQSINEELATVNFELRQRVTDLSRAINDMNNLLAGTGISTIFVDHLLVIQRFTPGITQVINLIESDIGRPVGHIASNLIGYTSLVEDVKAVLANLKPKEVEVQTHAGAWYLLRIRPYRTMENVVQGAVILFFDITEMMRLREERRLSEAIVQRIADSLPQLAWTFGADGACDHLSPQWLDYTGIPQAEQLGLGWIKQLHPEDRDRMTAAWNQSIGSGEPLHLEYRIRGKDGSYRWFRSHIAPVRDGKTAIVQWFGVNSEIDGEREKETALRDGEAKHRILMESISRGVLFHSREGYVADANPAAERILGFTADRMLNKDCAELLPGAVQSDGSEFSWDTFPAVAARKTGQPVSGAVMGVPLSGKEGMTWLRIDATPLVGTDESPPYPVCTIIETFDAQGVSAPTGGIL